MFIDFFFWGGRKYYDDDEEDDDDDGASLAKFYSELDGRVKDWRGISYVIWVCREKERSKATKYCFIFISEGENTMKKGTSSFECEGKESRKKGRIGFLERKVYNLYYVLRNIETILIS